MGKEFQFRTCGARVDCNNALLLLIKIMLSSKLDCQKVQDGTSFPVRCVTRSNPNPHPQVECSRFVHGEVRECLHPCEHAIGSAVPGIGTLPSNLKGNWSPFVIRWVHSQVECTGFVHGEVRERLYPCPLVLRRPLPRQSGAFSRHFLVNNQNRLKRKIENLVR